MRSRPRPRPGRPGPCCSRRLPRRRPRSRRTPPPERGRAHRAQAEEAVEPPRDSRRGAATIAAATSRGVAQLAEHRSPKPGVAGSSPAAPVSPRVWSEFAPGTVGAAARRPRGLLDAVRGLARPDAPVRPYCRAAQFRARAGAAFGGVGLGPGRLASRGSGKETLRLSLLESARKPESCARISGPGQASGPRTGAGRGPQARVFHDRRSGGRESRSEEQLAPAIDTRAEYRIVGRPAARASLPQRPPDTR